jgi:hypothetical protein
MVEIKRWAAFVKPCFSDTIKAERFVKKCENLPKEKQNAKLMLHQAQRLVTLADDIYKIRPRDSLRVLFLISCAEAIAKLYENFTGECEVYKHVELFFTKLCDPKDIKSLNNAFYILTIKKQNKKFLCLHQAIRYLYTVRCDVVHEGRYWEFFFRSPDMQEQATPNFKKQELICSKITYDVLRNIVVKGATRAIDDYIRNKGDVLI